MRVIVSGNHIVARLIDGKWQPADGLNTHDVSTFIKTSGELRDLHEVQAPQASDHISDRLLLFGIVGTFFLFSALAAMNAYQVAFTMAWLFAGATGYRFWKKKTGSELTSNDVEVMLVVSLVGPFVWAAGAVLYNHKHRSNGSI